MIRLICCGDRNWDDIFIVDLVLGQVFNYCKVQRTRMVLIEGGARGADDLVAQWARGYTHDPVLNWHRIPADWDRYGKKAGPLRNQVMLRKLLKGPKGAERYCFALHSDLSQSKGTAHMVRIARKAGVRTYVIGRF